MIELGVRAVLRASAGVTGIAKSQIVNGVSTPGVFCQYAPEGFKTPYVLVDVVSSDPMNSLDQTTGGLESTDFEVSCHSRNDEEVRRLRQAVREALQDYEGDAGPDDTIKAVWLTDTRPDIEVESQGNDQRQFIEILSFTIQHQPARAT